MPNGSRLLRPAEDVAAAEVPAEVAANAGPPAADGPARPDVPWTRVALGQDRTPP